MTLLIPEILDLVQQAKTKEEKVQLLRKHQTDCLIVLMRLNFDPMLWMDLPEGEPPYKKEPDAPLGLSPSNLYNEFRKFYIWLSPNTGLSKFKKEARYPNQEFFIWHHYLTGSCESGRKIFVQSKNIDLQGSMTVLEFLNLTKNEYNGNKIRELIESYK